MRRTALLAGLPLVWAGASWAGSVPAGAPPTTAGPVSGAAASAAEGHVGGPGPAAPASARRPAPPAELELPALSVRTPLIPLGIDPDGALEVPVDSDLAGWWTGSSAVGEPGPTVVAGHVDSADGPAVFHGLSRLQPGDLVLLRDAAGRQVTYRVERSEQHAKDDFPTFAVYGAAEDDVLRLITCAGAFDHAQRSYRDNLVVHARAVA